MPEETKPTKPAEPKPFAGPEAGTIAPLFNDLDARLKKIEALVEAANNPAAPAPQQ